MGWLVKVFTQNIDMLEFPLLNADDAVECHGTCRSAYCMQTEYKCNFSISSSVDMETYFWKKIRNDQLPTCPICNCYLRPAVTFFGEPLPSYFEKSLSVLTECDLLLVMGTSLSVYPVASLPNMVDPLTVRMLFNNETRGCFQFVNACNVSNDNNISNNMQSPWENSTYRDIFYQDSCDNAVEVFVRSLDKSKEFQMLLDSNR